MSLSEYRIESGSLRSRARRLVSKDDSRYPKSLNPNCKPYSAQIGKDAFHIVPDLCSRMGRGGTHPYRLSSLAHYFPTLPPVFCQLFGKLPLTQGDALNPGSANTT